MTIKELIDLISWDMKVNRGINLDAIRAKLLLLEIRFEEYIYSNLFHRNIFFRTFWYLVRFSGSIFQWILCNSNIPGTIIIGRGLRLPHPQNIVITGMATLGEFCMIYHNVTIAWNGFNGSISRTLSPKLGKCVLVGTGSIIIGNVVIGQNVIVGAGTIVAKSVPDYHQVISAHSEVSIRSINFSGSLPGSKEHLSDFYSLWR